MIEVFSVVLGGVITILTAIFVEYLRTPQLELSIDKAPLDFQNPLGAPAREMRSLRLMVSNKPLWRITRWITRAPAQQCRGEITFHHLDGQNIFGRSMDARWAESAQPVPISGRIRGDNFNDAVIEIYDLARFNLKSRIDIYPGQGEPLDIATRLDDDQECYGWNNEAYFCTPPWRNQNWKLPHGRFLVRATVTSSGPKCVGVFRLINDVGRKDCRLEHATQEQRESVEVMS